MTKFAVFNDGGFPQGFYTPEIHGDSIPQSAVEISDEQWQELLNHPGARRWDGVGIVAHTPPPIDPLTKPLPRLDFWLIAASVGVSKWSVRDRIAAMPEATPEEFRVKAEAIAWFEEAGQYRRNDPILIAMAEAEGITSGQLDALWVWAVTPNT